jgi:hypothetical protein
MMPQLAILGRAQRVEPLHFSKQVGWHALVDQQIVEFRRFFRPSSRIRFPAAQAE